ncbi:MAG: hypothetical protein P8H35_00430 [Flavobacteriales bacterium]|nr:hypothetical protein [Flavobacteriales bacterium]
MEEDKKELMEQIGEAINEVVKVKEIQNIKSLSRHNPQKVAKVLYLYATGVSQTRIVRKYKVSRDTVLNILVDYADHIGKLKDLAGRISAKNYMNISSLEEDLVDKVRDRMETDPEMEVTFRDLKELSIAKSNAFREAMSSRGEAHSITEDRKIITQDDYNETIRAAQERIKKIKGEVIDLDD